MDDHEFIEVGNRRWCIRCDCFQQKSSKAAKFWKSAPCDNLYNRDRPRPLADQFALALSPSQSAPETVHRGSTKG